MRRARAIQLVDSVDVLVELVHPHADQIQRRERSVHGSFAELPPRKWFEAREYRHRGLCDCALGVEVIPERTDISHGVASRVACDLCRHNRGHRVDNTGAGAAGVRAGGQALDSEGRVLLVAALVRWLYCPYVAPENLARRDLIAQFRDEPLRRVLIIWRALHRR